MTIVVLERRRLYRFGLLVLLVAAGAAFVVRNLGTLDGAAARAAAAPRRAVPVAAPVSTARSAQAGATGSTASSVSTAGYFAQAHLQRDQAQSRELAQLQQVAADAAAGTAVRAQAQEQILQLQQIREEETQAELVLQAKGLSPSLVLLRPGGATVVVAAPRFTAAMAALVAQAVGSVANLDPADVQIVVHAGA